MPTFMFAQRASTQTEINISANKVLVALVLAFCLAAPVIWGFVRYLLFAP